MEIKYLGWQSFRIRGKEATVLTQPFDKNQQGVLFPKTTAEIILAKDKLDSGLLARISSPKRRDGPIFFSGSGEYEAEGVEIFSNGSSFWFRLEGNGVCWSTEENLNKNQLLPISQTDILLLGLGKPRAGWSNNIRQLIDHFSPSFLIPFPNFSLSRQELVKGDWLKDFLDLVDEESLKPIESLKVLESDALSEEKKIVVLKPLI